MNKKMILAVAVTVCLILSALPIQVRAERTTILEMLLNLIFPKLPSETEHIKILNPVSKPTLWGRWIVEFETKGEGTLEIQAYRKTYLGKSIEFVKLECGNERVEPEVSGKSGGEWIEGVDNGRIVVKKWKCERRGRLVLRILETGHHYLKFSFLGEEVYAENWADCTGTDVNPCHCCDVSNMWVTVTAPSGGGESGPHAMTYQSSEGACSSSPYVVNETWTYDLGYTFCPTEGTYVANVTAYAAGGDQTCASYENETINTTLPNLYTVNWDADQNWCDCKMGATGCNGGSCWNVGFDTGTSASCCGDDTGEYYRYCSYVAPQAGFPDLGDCVSSDDMCCDASSDCVNTDGTACTASGSTSDADGDGDVDYCLNNKWYDCYNNNAHCTKGGVNYECVDYDCVDYIINGGSGTTCDANNKCLYIEDSAGTVKARFDSFGYVDVKGSYSYDQSSLSPPAGSFIVKNSGGTVVLYIDSNGNLATLGRFYQQASPSPSGGNDFIIKDSSGTVVGYIDGATGNMYFKGDLHYNSDF